MIDRIVHHAEVISLKGDSYRLKDRDLGRITQPKTRTDPPEGVHFHPTPGGSLSAAVDTGAATGPGRGRAHLQARGATTAIAAGSCFTNEGFCDITQRLGSPCPEVSTTRGHLFVSPEGLCIEF